MSFRRAGLWHHDRCGRRLKAYVFLSDVTNETHPTEIARGSQRTLYYDYEHGGASRFRHEFVDANYDVETLTGVRGEGFVFDTNAIHRARVEEAASSRSVVMFEMDAVAKSTALRNRTRHVPPCPSSPLFLQPLPGDPFPSAVRAATTAAETRKREEQRLQARAAG